AAPSRGAPSLRRRAGCGWRPGPGDPFGGLPAAARGGGSAPAQETATAASRGRGARASAAGAGAGLRALPRGALPVAAAGPAPGAAGCRRGRAEGTGPGLQRREQRLGLAGRGRRRVGVAGEAPWRRAG
ncbi:unnamed protein product, partial [Prorocentrum cordatum]